MCLCGIFVVEVFVMRDLLNIPDLLLGIIGLTVVVVIIVIGGCLVECFLLIFTRDNYPSQEAKQQQPFRRR